MKRFLCLLLAAALTSAALAQESQSSRVTPVVVAVKKAGPSVVNISTEQIVERTYDPFLGVPDRLFDSFSDDFRRYFSTQMPSTRYIVHSLGSGVIISTEGYVVTNEHVVRRASRITATLADGGQFEAMLLSSDPKLDLALLKIDSPQPLPFVTMGNSSDLMVGETVIAVGNPFGLENSVTTGVLSATNRSIESESGALYIQTTALINPGNSGGPLLNIDAELIGINTAIQLGAQGIGFATPVDDVKQALLGLLDLESVKNASLGVEVAQTAAGVSVKSVRADGPAEAAGVKPGDAILKFDGRPVNDALGYLMAALSKDVGDVALLQLERQGVQVKAELKAGAAPPPAGADAIKQKIGAAVYSLSAYTARRLGAPTDFGVRVYQVEPTSPAGEIGMKPDDVITYWNGTRVRSVSEMAGQLAEIPSGQRVNVTVLRGEVPLEAWILVR